MDKNIIGENIKRIRKDRKITQEELASLLNKSTISVRKWESGERTPRNEVLINIANELRVPLADLYEDFDEDDIIPNWLKKINKKLDVENINNEIKILETIQDLLKYYNYTVDFIQLNQDQTEVEVEIKSLISQEKKTISYDDYLDLANDLKHFIDFKFYCFNK